MNKQELIKAMAENAGITQTAATVALQSFEVTVSEALANGDTVKLVGFGTFKVNLQKARIARNPKTGDSVDVAAKNRVSFVAGKGLKAAAN